MSGQSCHVYLHNHAPVYARARAHVSISSHYCANRICMLVYVRWRQTACPHSLSLQPCFRVWSNVATTPLGWRRSLPSFACLPTRQQRLKGQRECYRAARAGLYVQLADRRDSEKLNKLWSSCVYLGYSLDSTDTTANPDSHSEPRVHGCAFEHSAIALSGRYTSGFGSCQTSRRFYTVP